MHHGEGAPSPSRPHSLIERAPPVPTTLQSHSLTAAQCRALYPRFDEFLQLRAQLDPGGLFLNDYLERHLLPSLPPAPRGPNGPPRTAARPPSKL